MKQVVKWKRKDGRVIPINKLSNSHVLNMLSVIKRATDPQVSALFPKYKVLVQEAKRRKLLSEVI